MTTDITELAQRMKAAAEKASNGEWVKESGDGWEVSCSANDQANGGFIIAHFEGPDAAENREFVQTANPANIRALVEVLEKVQQRNAELEAEVKIPGVTRCNTCGFSRTTVIVTPGGVQAGESVPEHCPNGCGPMRHDTYRRQYNELYDAYKELESKLTNPVQLPKTNGYWTETEKAYEEAITLAKRQIRLAGFRCAGDE